MEIYLRLFAASLVPVFLSVIFYLLNEKTAFGKLDNKWKQIIIGIIFGGAAIFGTEFGVNIGGATANARDAAPLCAGLLFGGPAGIIAGIIGGVERWFAVYWGVGAYSQVACSVSTALAGFLAAGLRKLMFDDKRPTWGFGLATGIVMEVIHLTILFLTHLADSEQAYRIVKICTFPMIFSNGIAVMLASLILSILCNGLKHNSIEYRKITQQVQIWLMVLVVSAYLVTTVFVYILQTYSAKNSAEELMRLNVQDVKADIMDASDSNTLELTHKVAADYIASSSEIDLTELAKKYEFTEINIVDRNAVITKSTVDEYIGFVLDEGQAAEFSQALLRDGKTQFVQAYMPISFDATRSMKYAAVSLPSGGYIQTGYNAAAFMDELSNHVKSSVSNRHINNTGYLVVADENGILRSTLKDHVAFNLEYAGIDLNGIEEDTLFEANVYGEDCMLIYSKAEGYTIVAVMPKSEVFDARDKQVYVNSYMEVIVFSGLFAMIYYLIKKLVVNNIWSVNTSLGKIIGGDLETVVNVKSSDEFASLSEDINSTVSTLKKYIAEAAARIDKELAFAKSIQHDSLPSVFPAYPNIPNFDIYATMETAKEVGGDFYDFYMIGDSKFAFLIADVSGKGIPAAMFMMTAKTMIKNFAESGMEVNDILTHANAELCQGNDAGMFVTAWMGIMDIHTGHVTFCNAGHNPPVIYRKGQGFDYLKSAAGFVLAGLDGYKYKMQELDLAPGDRIYLYTDGITEATSINTELYGEDRLLNYLNNNTDKKANEILPGVKADIDVFIDGAEQFDDMTMLMVDFFGDKEN